ncbi:MAG: hypothetical protein CL844_03760, partial [Crocinitomicaceae bacterium]|nr:hypothetical protein [Crocinitomicaceae bacterium]
MGLEEGLLHSLLEEGRVHARGGAGLAHERTLLLRVGDRHRGGAAVGKDGGEGLEEAERGHDEHGADEDGAAHEEGPEARDAQVVLELVRRAREDRAVLARLGFGEDGAAHGVEDEGQAEDDDERDPAEEEAGREAADAVDQVALHRDGKDEAARGDGRQGRDRLVVHVLRNGDLVKEPAALVVVPLLRDDALGPRHPEARAADALADDDDEDADDHGQHEHALRELVGRVVLHALRRLAHARVGGAAVGGLLDGVVEVAAHLGRGERQQEEHEELQEQRHEVVPRGVVVGAPAAHGALPPDLRHAVLGAGAHVVRRGDGAHPDAGLLLADGARQRRVVETPRRGDEDAVEEEGSEHGDEADGQPLAARRARGGRDHQAVADVVQVCRRERVLLRQDERHERLREEEDDRVAEQEADGEEHGHVRPDAETEALAQVHARAHVVRRGLVEAVDVEHAVRVEEGPRLDARQGDAIGAVPRVRAHRRELELRDAVRIHVLLHVGREHRSLLVPSGPGSGNVVHAQGLRLAGAVDRELLQRPRVLGLAVAVEAALADVLDERLPLGVDKVARDGGRAAGGDGVVRLGERLVVVGDLIKRQVVYVVARRWHVDHVDERERLEHHAEVEAHVPEGGRIEPEGRLLAQHVRDLRGHHLAQLVARVVPVAPVLGRGHTLAVGDRHDRVVVVVG